MQHPSPMHIVHHKFQIFFINWYMDMHSTLKSCRIRRNFYHCGSLAFLKSIKEIRNQSYFGWLSWNFNFFLIQRATQILVWSVSFRSFLFRRQLFRGSFVSCCLVYNLLRRGFFQLGIFLFYFHYLLSHKNFYKLLWTFWDLLFGFGVMCALLFLYLHFLSSNVFSRIHFGISSWGRCTWLCVRLGELAWASWISMADWSLVWQQASAMGLGDGFWRCGLFLRSINACSWPGLLAPERIHRELPRTPKAIYLRMEFLCLGVPSPVSYMTIPYLIFIRS